MFKYQIIDENEFTTFMPEGELAYDVCNELGDIVAGHIGPGMLLSFDMEKVSFLDCAGVGFLVKMKKQSDKRNGSFELLHPQKNVKLVLDRLTLNEFLNIANDAITEIIQIKAD